MKSCFRIVEIKRCSSLEDKKFEVNRLFTTLPRYAIIIVPGDVAQLEERDNRTVEVRGSSPLISTLSIKATKSSIFSQRLSIFAGGANGAPLSILPSPTPGRCKHPHPATSPLPPLLWFALSPQT